MIINRKQLYFDFQGLFAGALLPLAFAPLRFFPLAIFCPFLLLWGFYHATPARAAFRGWLFGIGFWGVGVSWVYISLHRFGGFSMITGALLTLLFILAIALFFALLGACFNYFFPTSHNTKWLLAFPALWVLIEWLRDFLFTGFPWLYLGYSQTNTWLKGFFPIGGVYFVSWLVALSASLLFLAIIKTHKIKHRLIYFSAFLGIWMIGFGTTFISWSKPIQKISVTIIQGNIPQSLKWTPAQLAPTLHLYYALTQKHLNSQLIIWPEAAVPMLLSEAESYLTRLDREAKQKGATLILGIPIQIQDKFYNAAISIGKNHGIYYKRHLVPFGEYLPMSFVLDRLMQVLNAPVSVFSPGPKHPDLLTFNQLHLATYICYEIAFDELIHEDLPQANLLLSLSNDAWFGDAWAADQHLQIAETRSLETSRITLFSTNNGITAMIAPNGKIIASLPKFKTAVLTETVEARKGETLTIRLGTAPIILLFLGLLIIARIRQTRDF